MELKSIVPPKKYDPVKAHEEYLFFKSRGICPICRKNKSAIGFVQCPECLEKGQLRSAGRDREQVNAKARERYHRRKAEGICVDCKSRKAEPGKVRCSACAKRQMYRARRQYIRRVKPDGVCCRKGCQMPTVAGMKTCETHYQQMVEHARMMRETAAKRGTRGWDNKILFPRGSK